MDADPVEGMLKTLPGSGPFVITEWQTKNILRQWGLPIAECQVADTLARALHMAGAIGYPVVLKVHSSILTHKSDAGGVKLNLKNAAAVKEAYREIRTSCSHLDPAAQVLVQPMLPPGIEVILGVSNDPQFGPVLMFGLGGVYAELFSDVSFRLIPVTLSQAKERIISTRAHALLQGFRGKPGGDIEGLAGMIVRLSDLIHCHPEIVEVDLNPVIVYPQGAAVADARMVIRRR